MQVSVESGEGLERKLTVQVPAETIDKEVESRLNSMRSRVKIDGFRPGKVPLKVVKQQYGASVLQEVAGEVMQNSLRDAVIQESLNLAGDPTVEPKRIEAGQPLEFTATFEVYPEITLADCAALKVERTTAEVTDDDVEGMIETLLKQRMTYDEVDRASQDGDQMIINFNGSIGGEAFEGGQADSVPVVIGSNSMIPGFEDQLVGKSANDEFQFEVTFPQDYHTENLKGKLAIFETKVITVNEPVAAEVNEEFAKSFGVEDGSVETLRSDIRQNMERELRNKLQDTLKKDVMDKLLDANEVLVPTALIERECENLQKQMTDAGQLQGGMSLPKELFEGEAKRRVGLGLVMSEVIKSAGLKPDAEQVEAKIQDIAQTYEDPQEVINHYSNNPQLKQGIEGLVMEEMVVEWIVEQATVSEVPGNFQALMNPESGK
ncbi:Cell division trigger factor [hydrothermal vent metagenome]|uniref:peptidylprolyl isomerase n=1 Tax=hydrothermal vent metagenome TaxID=652676 RepID=A0A3B0X4G2_9ZZZZ